MSNNIYKGTRLRNEITLSQLVTIHYFEFSKNYVFKGEAHDFWELVYVDKGSITAVSDKTERKLGRGDIVFHKPNEWHSLFADGENSSSVIIISFYSASPALSRLTDNVFKTGNREHMLLSEIITEAQNAFDTPLSDLVTPKLNRRNEHTFGSEQIIKLNLCRLIINLIRGETSPSTALIKRNLDEGLFGEITDYLIKNTDKKLTQDNIARHAGISTAALKQLFRSQAHCGVCQYFSRLKIDRAKTYIREDDYNFTQIAELLGYSSVYYFSTQFKKIVHMSPSEYAASVKALTNQAKDFSLPEE